MRVGFFQFAPARGDRDGNLRRITGALERADADLLVLPELATSGYLFDSRSELAALAEPVPGGPTCRLLAGLCRRRNLAVVVGLPEVSGGRLYNSAVLVTPGGECHTYRKAHLFLDEKDLFSPGDLAFPVFEFRGVRLGLLVCFDHFFPEAARALALKGAQVICHPSNLVLRYAHITTACRSIENRVFWVLANRTGTECAGKKRLSFIGESQVLAPGGSVLVRAGAESEELQVVEIDPTQALDKNVTRRNHLLNDRRTDLY